MPALKKVVSCGASKEAALYFEYVFPTDFIVAVLGRSGKIEDALSNCLPPNYSEAKNILPSLVPGIKDIVKLYHSSMLLEGGMFVLAGLEDGIFEGEEAYNGTNRSLIRQSKEKLHIDLSYRNAVEKTDELSSVLMKRRRSILRRSGFLDAPEWVLDSIALESDALLNKGEGANFAMSLRGLKLVDPSRLSWEQILEFRKDREARAALRNLRLFFEEQGLSQKDPELVADKLSLLVDEQDKAARLWGFETVQKGLSVAFTHRSVLATAAGGLAGSLAGAPLAVAAAAALVVPLGSFALEFSRAAIDAAKSKTAEPTKFLTHLRKLGEQAGD